MKSLSKQQRDYFIDRIRGEINKEIAILEQIHATGKDAKDKWNAIRNRMQSICTALDEKTEYSGKEKYFHAPYNTEGVEKFLRKICNSLARDNFINTPKGKRLKELEDKRTAAVDIVMGMTETEPLVRKLNKIFKGTNVPLLGGE